jgi:hypothetical protein
MNQINESPPQCEISYENMVALEVHQPFEFIKTGESEGHEKKVKSIGTKKYR